MNDGLLEKLLAKKVSFSSKKFRGFTASNILILLTRVCSSESIALMAGSMVCCMAVFSYRVGVVFSDNIAEAHNRLLMRVLCQ